MKTQGNLKRILMDSISKASSFTWENNTLKWGLHYVNTRTFIHFIPHAPSQSYAQCLVTNPSAFWKGHRLCSWKGFFRNSWTWWGAAKRILPHNMLLKFWLWTVSFPLAAFALLEISSLTWHKSEKHDQITKYSNPSGPLPLEGGKEGVTVGSPRWNPFEVYLVLSHWSGNGGQTKWNTDPQPNHIRTP